MKCLLQHHNVDVNGISSGLTALHAACQAGHLACVILLLQYGARRRNLDSSDNEAIHSAVQSGNIDILRLLMRPHNDITSRLVNISEENDVVEANLVDLDDNSPTNENNNRFGGQEILDINARNALRQTPLHLAVNRQNIPMVRILTPDSNGFSKVQKTGVRMPTNHLKNLQGIDLRCLGYRTLVRYFNLMTYLFLIEVQTEQQRKI
ncbi:unnamed protein product [Schistosoma mattheei]|uniref:Uncharacterized protein n=1 Tax=Schistosoma mattheei TaxID=31246 RepID=A0A3P8DWP1_9TREM|nr:unnamed protein product [Schistosoma mattheei]